MAVSLTRQRSTSLVLGRTDQFSSHYDLGQSIGQPGQYGAAYRCTHKETKEVRAVKIINKARFTRSQLKGLASEVHIMEAMEHPNIITYHEAYEDNMKLYFVMELCTGGELFDRIKARARYSEKDAAGVLKQMLLGIKYMHEHKVAHCDLKPDNFLFKTEAEDSLIKVIDFGMSKYTKPRQFQDTLCGTSFYIAPEVLTGRYTYHCDMWSFGVVVFIMIFGYPPFHGSDAIVHRKIKKGFSPQVKSGYGAWFPEAIPASAGVRDLIAKCLETNATQRLSAQEALDHPWFEEASTNPLLPRVLKNLTSFTASCRFKAAVLRAMGGTLSEEELSELKQAFQAVDIDGDGTITVQEIKAAMEKAGHVDSTQQAVANLLALNDVDGDGQLDYEELMLAAVQKKLIAKEDRLWNTFNQLDVNGDGCVTAEEIEQVLGAQEGVAEMIAEVDQNGDGQIDYDEFLSIFITREQPQEKEAE